MGRIEPGAYWAVVKKELTSVMRDSTIWIAVVIQLFLASFSSALLVGMLSLYDPESVGEFRQINLSIALVGGSNNPLGTYLEDRGLKVYSYASLESAAEDYDNGKVSAILSVPEETGPESLHIRLYMPRAQARASLILMILQDPLRRFENYMRQMRGVEVRYTDLQGKPPTQFEFIYSVIIPILMFFPAFVAGGMVVDSISEEVVNDTLETLLSAPVSLTTVVNGKITAAVFLAIVQCIAWLGVFRLNNTVVHNPALVLLLATIVAGIITVSSAFVATVFKDRERSQFVYSLFVMVATSVTYLLNVSPVITISRLAAGDFSTGLVDVLGYAVFLGVLVVAFWRATRRVSQ
jgi:ABC-2 type transport system permease protein